MTEGASETRASDQEREQTAETLREALAEGRLRVEEFQKRLEATYQARTREELEPLVRDLPVPSAPRAGVRTPASAADLDERWRNRVGGKATSRRALALLGGFNREGNWTVPSTFTGVSIMGGGRIDLREARFEEAEVVIRCYAVMGGVEMLVHPDVDLEVRGIGIMGGFDSSHTGVGRPGAPRVVVTGLAVWGGVSVRRETPRQEHDGQREDHAEERLPDQGAEPDHRPER